jgi:phosphomevalonate kinase
VVEVFASPVSAVTRELLARVRAFAEGRREQHDLLMKAARSGAVLALHASTVEEIVRAIALQTNALGALGDAAGAPIVTAEVAALRPAAEEEHATFAPSGAGGGDVAMFVGSAPSSARFRALAAERGLALVALRVGAAGTSRLP